MQSGLCLSIDRAYQLNKLLRIEFNLNLNVNKNQLLRNVKNRFQNKKVLSLLMKYIDFGWSD